MTWFFVISAILFGVLAWRRLDWALGLTIVLLPAYLWRLSIFGLPTTYLEIMILLSAGVWLIKNWSGLLGAIKNNWRQGRVARPYPWSVEIVAVLAVSVLAVGVSGFSWSAVGLWRAYFLEPILFYLIVFNVLGRGRDWSKIILPLSLSAVGVAAVAWYQFFVDLEFLNPVWSQAGRATSVFAYSNAVGLYLAPIVLVVLSWWFFNFYQKKQKLKTARLAYYAIVIILSVGAIIFAKSDGALLGLGIGVVVFGWLANKKMAMAMTVLLVMAVSAVMLQPRWQDYVLKQVTLKNLSGEIRKLQWREALVMLQQDNRWLWGAGLAGYAQTVAPFHQEGLFFNRDNDPDFKAKTIMSAEYRATHWQPVEIYLYPHNIFLNFWSELGLAGLLFFVWIFVKYFYLAFRSVFGNWKLEIGNLKTSSAKYISLGLLCAMLVIIIHGLVDVPYFKNDLAVLFWLLLAMMGLVNIKSK